MKIRILVYTDQNVREFKNGHDAIKYLKTNRATKITMNNESCTFTDIAELYQLEIKEKQHWELQNQ